MVTLTLDQGGMAPFSVELFDAEPGYLRNLKNSISYI